ncbi:uncharacterized protein [Phaseolus vulgaris]|uniref:uncharacterized protein n=1 Tax=Phaseolus vulgaris TaxID=3885 RepID=UPI0035CC72DF
MLDRLGFCAKWIRWIKCCLESASVSVLVNGSPTREFTPRKGLRQGDPLAPFLFLLIAEGLAGVSRMAEEKNLIDSLEVGRARVNVNMLQYADDTLFFCEANTKSIFNIKAILLYFELASGLKVNFLKADWADWGKWIWRLGTDIRGLWKEILDSKYGGWRSLREDNKSNRGSLWWKDLKEGGFPRLFSISSAKDAKVAELGYWYNGVWVWNLDWRRSFFDWEKSLVEQLVQLLMSQASVSINDVWGSIWVGIVSEIWNIRNSVIFNSGVTDVSEVFASVQVKCWSGSPFDKLVAKRSNKSYCQMSFSGLARRTRYRQTLE